jgi:multiple sugar transport system permease protein
MGWAFLLSFQHNDLITPPHSVGLANYRALPNDQELRQAISNTFYFTLAVVPLELILGLGIAMMLNQKIRLRAFYRTCFLVPYIASAAAEGILFAFIFDPNFGAINSMLHAIGMSRQGFLENPDQALYVIATVYLWGYIGLNIVIYMAALQDISQEVLEAAAIDGASAWARFRHVVVPTVAPQTVFLAIWGLIDSLQLFDLIYATTKGGPLHASETVAYYIYELVFGGVFFAAGYGAAVSVCLFAFTLLIVVFVTILERFTYGRQL